MDLSKKFLLLILFIAMIGFFRVKAQGLQPNETQVEISGEVNFDAWLGMDEIYATTGKPIKFGVYVKNIGLIVDDYNITIRTTGNLAVVSVPSVIEEVFPQEVKMDYIEVIPVTKGDATVEVEVTSQTNTTISKTLLLTIHSDIIASADSYSMISLLLATVIAGLLLAKT
ncbi:MAG: hypothetical protein J7K98_01735 [Candidatus Aenigmarchaeota archaeon]|nr:hypothetical protein [Candidatus Aenigmarchaeota archaeon]